MNKKYEMIIFDWDGTLMDSTDLISSCIINAFTNIDLEPPTKEQAINIIGLSLKKAIIALRPQASITEISQLTDQYRTFFFKSQQNRNHLYSGAIEVLDTLKKSGNKLAVATGKSRRGLNKVLADTGLTEYFITTKAADETRSKPDPLMLKQILDEFELVASQCLMIGDTEYDLAMAKSIDMPSLGVTYGAHSIERLKKHKPIQCINNITQILDYV